MVKEEFVYVPIKKIIHKKLEKNIPTYNIGVKDDESYMAKYIVVHNCRCRFEESLRGLR